MSVKMNKKFEHSQGVVLFIVPFDLIKVRKEKFSC